MSEAYGREEQVFVKAESTYGTFTHPAGNDAIAVTKCDMEGGQERKDIPEKSSTRSLITRSTGRKSASFSIEKFLRPSGTAGTKPDDSDLFKAIFGTETVGASDVAYTLLKEPVTSLTILRQVGHFQEAVFGAVPGKFSLKFSGSDEPKITFSGDAKDHIISGTAALASAASATDKIIVTDARQFAVGMKIKVGTEDNTAAGFTIDAIDYDDNELDLNANVTSQSSGAAVIPMPLTAVTAGSVIPVIIGSVTIGATTIDITSCTFDVDQKVKLRNDQFGYSSARGAKFPENRDVKVSLDLYFETGALKWVNDAKRFTNQDICVVLGETAGSMVQIDANTVELDIPKVDVPESEECTISLSGTCKGSTAEDEIALTFK